jgi:hypothetical protein
METSGEVERLIAVLAKLGYKPDGSLLYCSPGCFDDQADCNGGGCPNEHGKENIS